MEDIAIIGAGGFGQEVLSLITAINQNKNQYNFIGFFDDNTLVENVIGKITDIKKHSPNLRLVLAIGNPTTKKRIIFNNTFEKSSFPNLIHPNVEIQNNQISLGVGNIICKGVSLTTNIKIDDFAIVNLNSTIGHDCVIKDYCSIMPGVNVSGETTLEVGNYLGTGSTILQGIKIGKWATIGAGAVVIRDVPDFAVVVGNPGKIIKYNEIE
ncbi:MAG: acetyltransferase [Flavobacteriaceae bacterium]|nr:MAG: acetyltransferase [Flavobacteriaceae bacterium]